MPRVFKYAHDIADVGGKSGEAERDRLLVADIGKDLREVRQLGGACWDMEATLRHEREEAHGLEGHGLASRVGAGNEQCLGVLIAEVNRDGNDTLLLQERVAGIFQSNIAALVELRRDTVKVIGELCFGTHQVQAGHDLNGAKELLPEALDTLRELFQYFLNLGLLGCL